MVEPLEAAAVADELRLLDFIDQNPPQKPRERIEAALRDPSSLLLDDLLGPSVLGSVPGSPPGKSSDGLGELNEEEELEWLSNKDAFPPLETSFEVAGASPVSVLPKSFKVPVKARSSIRRKKRRVFPPVRLAAAPPPQAKEGRRCRHCEAEATPQWRVGPEGPKTLCNACGVRFKKGRLFPEYRPASSPTFSPAVHSNSTRGIMEMRMGLRRPGSRGRRRRPMAIS